MANDEADGGVHESLAATMRAAAVMAMQVGERLAKAWTDLARDAEQRATAEARLLAARIEAEHETAVAALTLVDRPDWWDRANVDEVARMLETATTWQDRDPAAARAVTVIGQEVQSRYGLTAEALQQGAQAGKDRAEAIEAVAATDALDRLGAVGLARTVTVENSADSEAAASTSPQTGLAPAVIDQEGDDGSNAGEVRYDSAERRSAFAAALTDSADGDLVAGRVRADVNFAHPAEEATTPHGSNSTNRGRSGSALNRPRSFPARTR